MEGPSRGSLANMRFKTKLTVTSAMLVSVALLLASLGLIGMQFLTEGRRPDLDPERSEFRGGG